MSPNISAPAAEESRAPAGRMIDLGSINVSKLQRAKDGEQLIAQRRARPGPQLDAAAGAIGAFRKCIASATDDLRFLRPRREHLTSRMVEFSVAHPRGFSESRRARWMYDPLERILAATRIRFVTVSFPERFGHLVLELDSLLREIDLERSEGGRPITPVLLLPYALASNKEIVDFFRRRITVLSSETAWRWLWPLLGYTRITRPLGDAIVGLGDTITYIDLLKRWGDRPGPIDLTPQEREIGWATLERLGVPRGSWFVCAHARTQGYSGWDDASNLYRNVDIASYRKAFEAIRARGGYVVRMGDPSMPALQPMDGVVDYANSDAWGGSMDLFLARECRFFLGCSSGPHALPRLFGRPVIQTNMSPHACSLGVGPQDLTLPKLLIAENGLPTPFSFIFQTPLKEYRNSLDFANAGVFPIENTADEVCEVVEEMMDRLDGTWAPDEDDEARQTAYRALFKPGDYSYGSTARVGRKFLERHTRLLA